MFWKSRETEKDPLVYGDKFEEGDPKQKMIDINKKVRNSERQFVLGDNETLRLMGYLK